ncbi:hypothetical protein ACFX58_14575 [Sphingomonas sp. NCPPB 2930]
MSYQHFEGLVRDLCKELHLPDTEGVLRQGYLSVQGFEIVVANYESDPDAMYLNFNFGVVLAGRSLRIFRLMLEANLTVYAQDQAQLGMDADTGSAHLVVRVPMTAGVDGPWLAETLQHYSSHGSYWRDTLLNSSDEMFNAVTSGHYQWIRA